MYHIRKNYNNNRWLSLPRLLLLLTVLLIVQCQIHVVLVQSWEWSDFVVYSNNNGKSNPQLSSSSSIVSKLYHIFVGTKKVDNNNNNNNDVTTTTTTTTSVTLSLHDVSILRVRDIKRRLVRNHGYTYNEINKILDKNELINTLAYEEEKIRIQYESIAKRTVLLQGVILSIIIILLSICYPLLLQVYEMIKVNIQVFYDRKVYEIKRCHTVQSYKGIIGVICMGILDMIKLWLSISILLSWFIKSNKYFFPTPNIPIRASDIINTMSSASSINNNNKRQQNNPFRSTSNNTGNNNSTPSFLSNYGINIGPMIIRWGIGYIYTKIETWTALQIIVSEGYQREHEQRQRKKDKQSKRTNETPEERQRKETKRLCKLEKELQKQHQQQEQQEQQLMNRTTTTNNNNTTTTGTNQFASFDALYNHHPRQSIPQQPRQAAHGSDNNKNNNTNIRSNTHDEFLQQMEDDLDDDYDTYDNAEQQQQQQQRHASSNNNNNNNNNNTFAYDELD